MRSASPGSGSYPKASAFPTIVSYQHTRRDEVARMQVAFGVLVLIALAFGPKVRGMKPAEDDGFLKTIKNH